MKPHKRAGAAIEITTSLPPAELASMSKQALKEESEKWLRIDQDSQEELIFGLREALREDSRQLVWHVHIQAEAGGATTLRSVITGYRQQQTFPFPATLLGLPRYEHWMRRLAEHVEAADPAAQVRFTG